MVWDKVLSEYGLDSTELMVDAVVTQRPWPLCWDLTGADAAQVPEEALRRQDVCSTWRVQDRAVSGKRKAPENTK